MSEPARMPTHRVAIALVRVKRGSTWITSAPRSRASITHWKPDRVVLGHVRAHDHDAVRVLEVLLEGRGAASSERGAQTGHRGAVSYAGLVLDLDDAERRHQLLDQVVLLVVERRAAEVRRSPSVRFAGSPLSSRSRHVSARVSTIRSAIISIASSSGSSSQASRTGRRYLTLYSRSGLCDVALRRLPLRAQAAAGDRARRVALDLADLAVLDVDELAAADRAVRADRLDDVLRLVDPRVERPRPLASARRGRARAGRPRAAV